MADRLRTYDVPAKSDRVPPVPMREEVNHGRAAVLQVDLVPPRAVLLKASDVLEESHDKQATYL